MTKSLFVFAVILLLFNSFGCSKKSSLFIHVKNNNISEVKRIVSSSPEAVEWIDSSGMTALDLAVQYDCVEIADYLLSRNANAYRYTASLGYPAHHVSYFGQVDILKALIQFGYKVDFDPPEVPGTALFSAASGGNFDAVKLLVENGANVNYISASAGNSSVLHVALNTQRFSKDQRKIVEYLIHKGASVNIKDDFNRYPIDYARIRNLPEDILILVNVDDGEGEEKGTVPY